MKKNIITTSCAALILGASFSMQAATSSLPIVEIFGTKYYLYECRKGDTMFGISRDQNWNDTELQRLNPNAVSPLKKGTRLYYPVNPDEAAQAIPEKISPSAVKEITHIVSKGETVYSISRMYGVPVETIYKLNPGSRNGIKAGQTISLRSGDKGINPRKYEGKNPDFHTVKKNDSLKSLAETYDTSVASLLSMNPGISPDNISEGTVIKLPVKGAGLVEVTKSVEVPKLDSFDLYTVKENDTWESIAANAGIDRDLLVAANPGVDKLKKKKVIAIPRVVKVKEDHNVTERDSRENSSEGIRDIYEDLHKMQDANIDTVTVKLAILAESPSAKKDVEFIRGFLTGVDRLKKNSYKIDLKVVDGSASSETVITELDDFKPNLVFFTGDKNIPSYLSEYASVSQTPVVNTFDIKSEEYLHNPYIIQLLTPSSLFNETVAANVYNRFGDSQLVLIGEEDGADQLAPELKKLWSPAKIKYLPLGIVDNEAFADNGKYLFYAYTVKKSEVEKVLTDISNAKEVSPFADIAVLARPNWIMFDESLAEQLHRVNTFIPSRFYMDDKSGAAKSFDTSFRTLFHRNPVNSLPLYAGVGYDASIYFIPAMAEASNDINSLKPSKGTVQSNFNLRRVNNWSGFINPPVFLVNFTPFDTVDKIVIE